MKFRPKNKKKTSTKFATKIFHGRDAVAPHSELPNHAHGPLALSSLLWGNCLLFLSGTQLDGPKNITPYKTLYLDLRFDSPIEIIILELKCFDFDNPCWSILSRFYVCTRWGSRCFEVSESWKHPPNPKNFMTRGPSVILPLAQHPLQKAMHQSNEKPQQPGPAKPFHTPLTLHGKMLISQERRGNDLFSPVNIFRITGWQYIWYFTVHIWHSNVGHLVACDLAEDTALLKPATVCCP